MTWTHALIGIIFLWSSRLGVGDTSLIAIRAIGGIAVLLGADNENR